MNKSKKSYLKCVSVLYALGTRTSGRECTWLLIAIELTRYKIDSVHHKPNEWVNRHENDEGAEDCISTLELQRLKKLKRENKEQGAAQSQRDLEAGQPFFCPSGAQPPSAVLKVFVEQHQQTYGIESICEVLQFASSGHRRHAASQRKPYLRCDRAQQDRCFFMSW